MIRPSQPLLAPLLAVLAMLLALTGSVSAAFTPAATEPHYGNFSLWETEVSGFSAYEIADPTKENGEWIYDDASGVHAYVTQNPWSSFDPHGLSKFNPLKALAKVGGKVVRGTKNVVVNTGRHLKEAGKQVVTGHPINALRVTVGTVTSVATGDLFDAKIPLSADATAISVNGIWNNRDAAEGVRDFAQAGTGQTTHAVQNGTHLKICDVLQCAFESFGAINTPSLNVADSSRKISENHPNAIIEVTAHSQGGSVVDGGTTLLNPAIRAKMSVQTFGAQYAANESRGYKDVYNERGAKDPVPYIDPRNLKNTVIDKNVQTYTDGNDGHGFSTNYGADAIQRSEESENQ